MLSDNYNQQYIDDSFNLKAEILKYVYFWRWFVLSVAVCLLVSLFYVRYSHNIYRTTAKIKVLDKKEATLDLPSANDLFSNSKINLENEIELLSSYPILEKVIRGLNLNTSFYEFGDIMTSRLVELPFVFEQLIVSDSIREKLVFQINFNDNGIEINYLNKDTTYFFPTYNTYTISHDMPFNIQWDESSALSNNSAEGYKVVFSPINNVVNNLKEELDLSMIGEKSDIIMLQLEGANTAYSEKILDAIITEFNQDGIKDRQMVHKRTIEFVNERYVLLSNELDSIEIKKQLYKLKNNLIDITANSTLSLELSSRSNQELLEIENQIALAKLLNDAFNDNNYDLLPSNIGINNSEINFLIKDFNTIIFERKNLIVSAGLNHPSVKQLDQVIIDNRANIIRSANNYVQQLQETKRQLESQSRELSKDVSNLPEKEKILRSIERNQLIKESLYLFLMKKREEAQVSFAITEPTVKVVEYAISSDLPISPKKQFLFLGALILGLLIPFSILYIIFLFDTKIHIKKDLKEANIGGNIIGEIPLLDDNESKLFQNPKDRNRLAESFRILTSNINFLLAKNCNNTTGKVILSTSTIKGEGKSFVAMNISLAFASVGKKVLLIGADLRNPQLHKYLSAKKQIKGLTNFLIDPNFDWQSALLNNFEHLPNHKVLLAGIMPPNPTQLLSNSNFSALIKKAKEEYDYIIIDTAPTLLVTDTLMIADQADATIYICKSNYTEKELLNFYKELIDDKKLKNVGLIINGIGANAKYGYGYNYGYEYSYISKKN